MILMVQSVRPTLVSLLSVLSGKQTESGTLLGSIMEILVSPGVGY